MYVFCKKCNNIVTSSEGVCKICGHPVRNGKSGLHKYTKFAIVGIVLILCGVFVVFYAQGRLDLSFIVNLFEPQITDVVDNGIYADTGNNVFIATDDDVDIAVVFDEEARLLLLSEVYTVASDFIEQFSAHFTLISNMGYLYNATENLFVTTDFLTGRNFLQLDVSENIIVLLLRPVDFADFEEVYLPYSNEMTLFVGHETITGIGLYSAYGYAEIFRENLNTLLLSYRPSESEIFRPLSSHRLYQDVVDLITNNNVQIDIRYMAANDDFVFTTVSNRGESHILRHYAFARGDDLTILAQQISNERELITTINQAAPNFNFNLLPEFSLNRDSLVQVDEDVLMAQLRTSTLTDNAIMPDYPPEFIATRHFYAYLVFTDDGSKFLASLANDWVIRQVANWQEAEEIIIENWGDINPPLYILRQE